MHPHVRWIIVSQITLTLLVAGFFVVQGDKNAAFSALIGGGIGVVANLLYVWRAMRRTWQAFNPLKKPLSAYQAYQDQIVGEAYKLVVTFVGFAWVFMNYKNLAVMPFFVGYISTLFIYWVALIKNTNTEKS